MAEGGGFIDLRLDHASHAVGEDSVWPSFTDIMTVIVMIFMMALVVIMIRNTELDKALSSSQLANEETTLENQGLAFEVNNLRSTIGELSESLNLTQSARDQLNAQLQAELERVQVLAVEKDNLNLRLTEELQRIQMLSTQKAGLEGQITEIEQESLQLLNENQQLELVKQQITVDLDKARLENETLAQQVSQLLEQRSALEQKQVDSLNQIALLQEKESTLTAQMDTLSEQFQALQIESEENISNLSGENKTLGEKIDAVTAQLAQLNVVLQEEQEQNINLNALLESEQLRYDELEASQKQLENQILLADRQILALNKLIQDKESENAELQAESQLRGQQLFSLQDEFEELEVKYRKLIRPARSTAGRHVVEVWLLKTAGVFEYRIKEPEQAAAETISRNELDLRLGALKTSKGNKLYTKVIIPESSQLTHDEAWRFTQDILNKYDYYYQPLQPTDQ